jgi:hypothetical protein
MVRGHRCRYTIYHNIVTIHLHHANENALVKYCQLHLSIEAYNTRNEIVLVQA